MPPRWGLTRFGFGNYKDVTPMALEIHRSNLC